MTSRMRTLQIINVRWFNATAWYGLYLASLLRAAGHDSRVVVPRHTLCARTVSEWGFDPIFMDLNTSNPLRLSRTYSQMGRFLKGFRPDIVNCHRGEGFFLWGLLKKQLAGGPNAFRLVRTRGDQRLPKNTAVNRWLHASVADAVVATNSVMARHFTEALHIPPEHVHTILGGVDTARFAFDAAGRERIRAEFGYGPEHCVLGLLGRFDEVKGQRELLDALASLYHEQELRSVRLLLLGFDSATSQQTVEGWIQERQLGEVVRITGKRPDVAACLSAVDVGVVASKWSETIARAALEIMACGRPLISTSVGVMPDLLTPDALFPPADAPAMARALRRAVTDPAWREALRAEQQPCIRTLSGERFLERTLSLYQGLLSS